MKKIFTLAALVTASMLIATRGNAQVYVHAHFGFPFRGPRVYIAPPPPVVCQEPPAVYQEPYPADEEVYADPNGYASSDGVVYEGEFPGYAYYDYPAWNGHYRDYYYYAHYRPFFERKYTGYFNGGRFDRGRFQRDNYSRGYANGGYANRGYRGGGFVNRGAPLAHAYGNGGNFNRSYGRQSYAGRGGFGGHDEYTSRGREFGNHGGGEYRHGHR